METNSASAVKLFMERTLVPAQHVQKSRIYKVAGASIVLRTRAI
jgi:hypothetical protein